MTEKKETARHGAGKVTELDRLLDELSGAVRRMRQEASHTLATMIREDPSSIKGEEARVAEALIDALFRPEAQTRWEALDGLTALCAEKPELVADAYDGAEASLFDENNSRVRIAAFCLLARMAAKDADTSDKVWPLLDEAIQCYHGDQGYRDMLAGMLEIAEGDASAATKAALAERIKFDAESGRGYVREKSERIVEAANAK